MFQEVETEANESVFGRFLAVVKCNKRLDEIENRCGSSTLLQHINQLIFGEKEGDEERIKSLKKFAFYVF